MTPARLAGAGLLAATASAGFVPVFGGYRAWPVLVGAAVVPVLVVGVLASGTRLVPTLRLAAGLAGSAVYLLLAVAPGLAVADGARQLTGAVPADPTGPPLAFAAALATLGGLGAAEAALRRRAALLPALAPLLVLVAALMLGAAAGPPPRWVPAGFAVGCGALLVLATVPSAGPTGRPAPGYLARRIAAGTAAVAVAAAAAVVLGPSLPGAQRRDEPFDARTLVPTPVVPKTSVSPLVRYPALRFGADRPLFTLRTAVTPDRLRWVTLPRFDGAIWTTDADYRRAGRRLPPGPHPTARERTVRQEYQVADPGALGWLPTVGRARTVSVAGLGVDERSGDLLVPRGVATPPIYTVTGVLTTPGPTALRSALPAPGPPPGRLPPEITAALDEATRGQVTAFGELAALAAFFTDRGGFRYDDTAEHPSGHGLYQIRRLLAERRGTDEQYASAYAVMVRQLGYDVRVVLGFRPPARDRTGAYPASSHDVHAWPEVRFEGLGWVAFDPAPRLGVSGAPRPEAARPPTAVDRAVAGATEPQPSAGPAGVGTGPATREPAGGWLRTVVATLLGLLTVLVVGYLAAVPAAKAARRRRRRDGDPSRRVLGAWREVTDRLTEHGVTATPSMTSGELTALAERRFAVATARMPLLARVYDAAAFGGATVTSGDAALAWDTVEDTCRAMSRSRPLPARLRATLDPRPLLRR